jgi:hypothetical protein
VFYDGTYVTASRAAWLAFVGPLPDPFIIVRHICENPPCINPEHLEAGVPGSRDRDAQRRMMRYIQYVRSLEPPGEP